MHALHAFMERIIDYAGLFPPAELPLPQVVRNFARDHGGPHATLLNRIICPTRRLDEFAELVADDFAEGSGKPFPWRVAALGRGGEDVDQFLAGLADDLQTITAVVERLDGNVRIDAYECRPPASVAADPEALNRLADRTALAIDKQVSGELRPYFELGFGDNWAKAVPAAIAALAAHNQTLATPMCRPAGVKIRTGGVTSDLVPTTEQVACLLRACHVHGVRFKATAGLHHPVRHQSSAIGAKMHGFFNVFGAAMLARIHDLDADAVRQILDDEAPDSFRFEPGGFNWRDLRATAAQIETLRRDFAISFGSCSLEEPVDDLRAMGLLADAVGAET